MCPDSPSDGQGKPLRHEMLIEGIFGLSLFGLCRCALRGPATYYTHYSLGAGPLLSRRLPARAAALSLPCRPPLRP